jgi:hypothetical protein
MDVRPAGPDPAAASFSQAAARVSPASKIGEVRPLASAPVGADSVSTLLKELTPPDIGKLLQVLEPLPPVESAALLETVLRAGQAHEVAAVLSAFQKLASLDPQLVGKLPARPELQFMRPQLEHLLRQLETVGKLSADEKLVLAVQLVEAMSVKKLPGWDAAPQTLLRVGHSLVEAGGLGNYAKAQDLTQVLIDAIRFLPVADYSRLPSGGGRASGPRTRTALNALSGRNVWLIIVLLAVLTVVTALFFSR